MNILTLNELNLNTKNNAEAFVKFAEEQYRERIRAVADGLTVHADMPIILISGPSGSGKTTTAKRLATMLEEKGSVVHILSMDDYFLSVDDPRNEADEDGNVDLESPKRLDMELLNEHLEMLWKCEEIDVPSFDFSTQKRINSGKTMKRSAGEFVIMEGIHALNPEITGHIGKHATTVYVSVRTRLEDKNGELLHPSKIRLMRRIMRDKLFRGRPTAGTLDFFVNVERGERRFIMPYKNSAMYDIDTFISYETAVYKPLVLEELLKIKDSYPDYANYADLEHFLTEIDGMEMSAVPLDSLVREFIGGSNYSY